jgi:lipopolysaccharide transport system ATP-binding protein
MSPAGDIAIAAAGLSKRYVVGHQAPASREEDLRESMGRVARSLARRTGDLLRGRALVSGDEIEEFWALRDVSFELRRGERLGIIGRNGAGKSTLLKILSRITDPSSGEAWIRGRVASLLEVGTGFHPDLTGRENVFLNGAILGMRRAEILRRFDEIVAFAEIERFLDTPVKRYSSGMYVRLAFAVAAHLDPEILIVDEVLSVGDAQFQEKCLGKMSEVAGGGRTVLFVSHNIAAVRSLCTHGILLREGRLAAFGPVDDVARAYLDEGGRQARGATVTLDRPRPGHPTWLESVTTLRNGEPAAVLETGDRLGFEVRFRSDEPIEKPIVGYLIRSVRGENAVNANNYFLPSPSYGAGVTEGTIVCDLGALPLMAGSYLVSFWLGRGPHELHHVEDVLRFTVEEKDVWRTGALPTRGLSCLWWPTEFRMLAAAAGAPVGPSTTPGAGPRKEA